MMIQGKCLRIQRTAEPKIILLADLANNYHIEFKKRSMTKLDAELSTIKEEAIQMWTLVQSQLQKGLSSLINFDKDLAREVIMIERRVNGAELKIDRDCEDIFAIYSPVAVDLRFLLAVLKINTNLERMGDIAEGI